MKTAFIKFLPIIAAVMLATSCSKDDNDNAPATSKDDVHTVATNTIPFSIRVNTGHSLKKVGYAESTNEGEKGWYNITFSDNDVANQLKMIIKEGNTPIGEATLQSDKATFSGSLTQQPSSNASLTAEIHVSGSKNSSDKSLADLLATCAHNFIGEFKFGDKTVDLTDQNAYLAISMSPCCEHEIKINTTDYTVKDGRIWIAIPSDADVTSTGLGKEISKSATEVSPGTIYTVARQCFTVADGKKVYFSPGNLQATYNGTEWAWGFAPSQTTIIGKAAANTSINGNGTVSANGTVDLFGWVGESSKWTDEAIYGISNSTTTNSVDGYGTGKNEALKSDWGKVFGEWYTLSHEEWVYLLGNGSDPSRSGASNLCHWASVSRVNGLIILPDDYDTEGLNWSSIDWATLESAGAVFLPAAGYRDGTGVYDVGFYGDYWSSSAYDEFEACYLHFGSGRVYPALRDFRNVGRSVRLVRPL